MGMEIWVAQAGIGDCILVRCGERERKVNILIDSGQSAGAPESVLKRLERLREKLDLLVFTHDDNDHVKGACSLLERLYLEKKGIRLPGYPLADLTEDRVLFNFGGNGTKTLLAAKDVRRMAEILREEIDFGKLDFVLADSQSNVVRLEWTYREDRIMSRVVRATEDTGAGTETSGHLELVILSPGKETLRRYIESAWKELNEAGTRLACAGKREEPASGWNRSVQYYLDHPLEQVKDTRLANNASISFLLFYQGRCALFAGDASPEDMVEAGRRYLKSRGGTEDYLDVDLIKLPHHGSSHNVNREFLEFFRTSTYLITTSGHAGYRHPGKGALALLASALPPGGRADIYSSYDWWKTNRAFRAAEQREGNWEEDGNLCRLKNREGGTVSLCFHRLGMAKAETASGIEISG